jgi:hypothetical protein
MEGKMPNLARNNQGKTNRFDHKFFEEVNAILEPFKLNVLRQLLPIHSIKNYEYLAINPKRDDKKFGSFKFNLNNNKWADFADNSKGGDLISLYAYLNNLKQAQAAQDLLKIVGRYL